MLCKANSIQDICRDHVTPRERYEILLAHAGECSRVQLSERPAIAAPHGDQPLSIGRTDGMASRFRDDFHVGYSCVRKHLAQARRR